MELSQILSSLTDDAVDTSTEKTASASGKLDTVLKEALEATEKTAAPVDPPMPKEDLQKIASRLASAEREALVKEAEVYGAAMCDGFMARMNGYEGAPGSAPTKTAAYGDPTPENFEKFASENPELVKQAVDLGYRETKHGLEKLASDSFAEGYEKTAGIIKTAAEHCARRGMEDTFKVLKAFKN